MMKNCTKCGDAFDPEASGTTERCAPCEVQVLRFRAYRQRPEVREKRIAQSREYYSRPEIREKRLAYMREYHSRPDVYEHRLAYNREYQRNRRARLKAEAGG